MRKTALYLLFFNIILGRTAFADTYMPGYDTVPNVEDATGAGVSLGSTPYPPMYLPGGSINLDDVWTLNGGRPDVLEQHPLSHPIKYGRSDLG